MIDIILDFIFLFLLMYALTDIAENMAKFFMRGGKASKTEIYGVLILTDDDELEYIVRKNASYTENAGFKLKMIDTGLSKENRFIAESLCLEYEHLELFLPTEYAKQIKDFASRTVLDSVKEATQEEAPGKDIQQALQGPQ